jgi:hypothetical protein
MAALTVIDVFNQYSNDRKGFINQMAPSGGKAASDAASMWDNFKRINPGGGSNTGGTTSISGGSPFRSVVSGTGDVLSGFLKTQEQQGYMPGMSEEMLTASGAVKDIFSFLSQMKSPLDIFTGGVKLLAGQAELYLSQQTELLGQINKGARMTGNMSEDVRSELTEANIPLTRLGIGFAELASASKGLINESGRFITLNRYSWEEAGKAATAYVGTLEEMIAMYPEFEKVGIGAGDVADKISDAGASSLNLGLQSSKVTKELSTNLSKLNEYGFQNGVKGLTSMIQKSTEFRMNMSEVFKIADKVMDPDGAISLAANLQVLGGAIGDFGDPLKMMYDATNNVEGLQDALIGAAGSLATYNSEQGRFEITGVNLRRAKAMAQELGVSYDELAKGAISAAERTSASAALMGRGLNLDEDQERFLTNISSMKGGQMTIEINSDRMRDMLGLDRDTREMSLEKLTQKQVDTILQYQDQFKQLSKEEIIQRQATTVENISRDVNFLLAIARTRAAKMGGGFMDDVKKYLGYDPSVLLDKSNKLANQGANLMGYKEINTQKVTKPKTNESLKIKENENNKKETTNDSSLLSDLKRDLSMAVKEGVVEGNNVTKYNSRQNITVQTVVNEENPNSYTYYSIGGR